MGLNRIHPTAVVSDGVKLGDDNVLGPYAVVLGPCRIGSGNHIAAHACIGGPPEYRGGPHPVAWDGEIDTAGVEIGDRNIIREFVTINQGLHRPTALGDECYLMTKCHLGHDVVLGDGVTVACAVQIGGHCDVWDLATIGLGALIHQFVRIGPGAMIGMGSVVLKEVEAFVTIVGNPPHAVGINRVGLNRQGCDDAQIAGIEDHVRGARAVPHGLPDAVGELLTRWAQRPPCAER